MMHTRFVFPRSVAGDISIQRVIVASIYVAPRCLIIYPRAETASSAFSMLCVILSDRFFCVIACDCFVRYCICNGGLSQSVSMQLLCVCRFHVLDFTATNLPEHSETRLITQAVLMATGRQRTRQPKSHLQIVREVVCPSGPLPPSFSYSDIVWGSNNLNMMGATPRCLKRSKIGRNKDDYFTKCLHFISFVSIFSIQRLCCRYSRRNVLKL